MSIKSMKDLFFHSLKDIYSAEKQIAKNLPKMAKAAGSAELRSAVEKHGQEADQQIERLETIFAQRDVAARPLRCEAMDGIISEAKDLMADVNDKFVRDAGMLSVAQAIKHYEISRYGTLIAWADQLGYQDASKLLREILVEEQATDQILSRIDVAAIDKKAA
jgi:ferritin-like metal-binding protein YciE